MVPPRQLIDTSMGPSLRRGDTEGDPHASATPPLGSPRQPRYGAAMTIHILLTGATRGIGAATAARLAAEDVTLVGTGSADGNLADPATPARLWQSALDRLDGRIDVLINNAGVFEAAPLDGYDADWSAS